MKNGHDEDHFWKLHPDLKSNKLKDEENEKRSAIIEHELSSYSRDGTKIITMDLKGKNIEITSSSSYSNETQDDETRVEFFSH